MRTTLEIDDDLLAAAREIARRERKPLGKGISQLTRQALTGAGQSAGADSGMHGAGGFRPFPSRGTPVTNETTDRLRDNEGV
ncbi:hypothetical protein [Aquisalimonas sp.]|uniref:type II toxin-antitoxin system VapB family antitoxin n=1 Tax=Aquisalimonas sp. TaxID=1872621 RepID=UPI0025C43520|nr:hypothetical protein [Aquisalimonas sp.]